MLTAPARPRYASFFRNTWKFRCEAQSTVSRLGRKPGSGPVTHCAAASAAGAPASVRAPTEPPINVRLLTSVMTEFSPGPASRHERACYAGKRAPSNNFQWRCRTTFNIAIQYRYRLRMLDDIVIVHRTRVL